MNRSTEDLVRIAAAGGGFRLDASRRPIDDLVRIAAAASGKNATMILENTTNQATNDLVRIAAAGKGSVIFV